MNYRIPEHLSTLRKSLTNGTYCGRIDEIVDMHTKNSTLHPDFDDITSRVVDVISAYNSELNKSPAERKREVMLKALTLPHDMIYQTIKELASESLDKLESRIHMYKVLTYELEEIKFLLHDVSREAITNDDISFSMLSVYQQAFITSRDILTRMEKLCEAVS